MAGACHLSDPALRNGVEGRRPRSEVALSAGLARGGIGDLDGIVPDRAQLGCGHARVLASTRRVLARDRQDARRLRIAGAGRGKATENGMTER